MKYIQKEKDKKYRYFLYKSHTGVSDVSACGHRNRKVKKGKHNCVKDGDYISSEYLSFGSMKAALRYVRNNLSTIAGEGRNLKPMTTVAIARENRKKFDGDLKLVWTSRPLSDYLKKKYFTHWNRMKLSYSPPFAYGCFVRKPTMELLKELDRVGRWFERPWEPKNLDDCTLIVSQHGGYWLTTYSCDSEVLEIVDCGEDHEKFLKLAKQPNWTAI